MTYAPQEGEALLEIDNQEAGLVQLATFLEKLHAKWKPHPGQVPLGRALFYGGFKDIFAEAGRNWGKTEAIGYCATRYANERPKSENYIFGPLAKQVREILWASQRIQNIGPLEYQEGTNSVEMRVTFNNKAFIKLDGSDNVEAYRGIKPQGLSVYDEFKDMRPNFIKAYDPNRAAYDSPAIYIGTPPEFFNHFVEFRDRAKKYHGAGWFYLHAPTSANPYISRAWLAKKRLELIEAGDEETWLREYEALYVKGGKRHIFPQAVKYKLIPFSMDLFKVPAEWVINVISDPAASSTFGVLFVAWHQYLKKSIAIREIYEQDQSKMTSRQIWMNIFAFWKELTELGFKKFEYVYDEAASWFRNETTEINECKEIWLSPTDKANNSRESGISIVRDAFNRKLLDICDTCPKLYWELENYIKDEKDRIPDKDDHLIDDLRYHFAFVGYNLHLEEPPKEPDPFLQKRGIRLEDELPSNDGLQDFDADIFSNHTLEEI